MAASALALLLVYEVYFELSCDSQVVLAAINVGNYLSLVVR